MARKKYEDYSKHMEEIAIEQFLEYQESRMELVSNYSEEFDDYMSSEDYIERLYY